MGEGENKNERRVQPSLPLEGRLRSVWVKTEEKCHETTALFSNSLLPRPVSEDKPCTMEAGVPGSAPCQGTERPECGVKSDGSGG